MFLFVASLSGPSFSFACFVVFLFPLNDPRRACRRSVRVVNRRNRLHTLINPCLWSRFPSATTIKLSKHLRKEYSKVKISRPTGPRRAADRTDADFMRERVMPRRRSARARAYTDSHFFLLLITRCVRPCTYTARLCDLKTPHPVRYHGTHRFSLCACGPRPVRQIESQRVRPGAVERTARHGRTHPPARRDRASGPVGHATR